MSICRKGGRHIAMICSNYSGRVPGCQESWRLSEFWPPEQNKQDNSTNTPSTVNATWLREGFVFRTYIMIYRASSKITVTENYDSYQPPLYSRKDQVIKGSPLYQPPLHFKKDEAILLLCSGPATCNVRRNAHSPTRQLCHAAQQICDYNLVCQPHA